MLFKIRSFIGLALVLVFLLVSFEFSNAEIPKVLPVLVYHHIQPVTTSDVSCTPEQFDVQIDALLKAGYTPLTLKQTAKFLAGILDESIKKPVLITFDDGYESLYHYALPISRKYSVPMTVFVVSARIGRKLQFAQYLHESQILEMHKCGLWDFGSHTHDMHTDSLRIFDSFGPIKENPLIEQLARDLRVSSSRLQAITGKKPEALAWPYGKFNQQMSAIARKTGFKYHFTSCNGVNEIGANPYFLRRIPVTARDTALSVLKKVGSR